MPELIVSGEIAVYGAASHEVVAAKLFGPSVQQGEEAVLTLRHGLFVQSLSQIPNPARDMLQEDYKGKFRAHTLQAIPPQEKPQSLRVVLYPLTPDVLGPMVVFGLHEEGWGQGITIIASDYRTKIRFLAERGRIAESNDPLIPVDGVRYNPLLNDPEATLKAADICRQIAMDTLPRTTEELIQKFWLNTPTPPGYKLLDEINRLRNNH